MSLALKDIPYQMYDEGEMKEYGLTRNERLKKQYIDKKQMNFISKIMKLF